MNKKEAQKDLLDLIEKLELADSARRQLHMYNKDILSTAYRGCELVMFLEDKDNENLTEAQALAVTIYMKLAEVNLKNYGPNK